MFFEQEEKRIDPKDYIPILNKSTTTQPPTQPSPTPSTTREETETITQQNNRYNNNCQNGSENFQSDKIKNNGLNKTKIKFPSKHADCVQFMVYENFILSKLTIKELCRPGTGIDVHICFYENHSHLPQIGVSCLSFKDLWSEQAEMQGYKTKPEELAFIKLIPYIENTSNWKNFEPLPYQILTISLDCADPRGIKIRLSFMEKSPSSWYWIRYPVLVNDFSLVIGIEKKALLRRYTNEKEVYFEGSLEIFTTFGLLNMLKEQPKKEDINIIKHTDLERKHKIRGTTEDKKFIKGRRGKIDEEECILCFRRDADTLFYPCNHCIVHSKCLQGNNIDECYICKTKCERLIKLKFPKFQQKHNFECLFCGNGKCKQFDCYYYPCGCTLGCFNGFKKALLKEKSKMSLHCTNCLDIIENVLQLYRS